MGPSPGDPGTGTRQKTRRRPHILPGAAAPRLPHLLRRVGPRDDGDSVQHVITYWVMPEIPRQPDWYPPVARAERDGAPDDHRVPPRVHAGIAPALTRRHPRRCVEILRRGRHRGILQCQLEFIHGPSNRRSATDRPNGRTPCHASSRSAPDGGGPGCLERDGQPSYAGTQRRLPLRQPRGNDS